jgi:hypothetical protein
MTRHIVKVRNIPPFRVSAFRPIPLCPPFDST